MSEYDLEAFQAGAVYQQNSFKRSKLLGGPYSRFKGKARCIYDNFLTLSSASLFVNMKTEMFFTNLCRSAENWQRFLQASFQSYNERPSLIYCTPLMAAVISQDKNVLTRVRNSLPNQWVKDKKYNWQFHNCWLFCSLALNDCQKSDEVLLHLDGLQAGGDYRFEAYRALLALDELVESGL